MGEVVDDTGAEVGSKCCIVDKNNSIWAGVKSLITLLTVSDALLCSGVNVIEEGRTVERDGVIDETKLGTEVVVGEWIDGVTILETAAVAGAGVNVDDKWVVVDTGDVAVVGGVEVWAVVVINGEAVWLDWGETILWEEGRGCIGSDISFNVRSDAVDEQLRNFLILFNSFNASKRAKDFLKLVF
jgi:hypothetical protein